MSARELLDDSTFKIKAVRTAPQSRPNVTPVVVGSAALTEQLQRRLRHGVRLRQHRRPGLD